VRLRMRETLAQLFSNTAGWKEVLRAPAAHGVSTCSRGAALSVYVFLHHERLLAERGPTIIHTGSGSDS